MNHKTKGSRTRTMLDIAANDFTDPNSKRIIGPGKGIFMNNDKVEDAQVIFTEVTGYEFREAFVKEYNENILSVADKYKSFSPFQGIVVRCYHRESTVTEGGLYIPMDAIVVNERTQNGIGVRETLPSPWQYSRTAVVIASCPQYGDTFKFGQKVLLNVSAIQAGKQSVDAPFILPNGFTHSEDPNNQPPTDIKNEDYGYLKIDPYKYLDGFIF